MGWMAETPPGFKFAVKAHQTITHIKRLHNLMRVTSKFVASLLPLEKPSKLGPVLFQLPPNLKCDLPLLADFLAGLPHHVRFAFEFRHDSWFRDDVFASLQGTKVALCLAESEKLKTPDVHTTDFSYMRMRKEEYSAKVRKALKQKVLNLAQKREVFSLLLGWRSIALSEGIFDQSFDDGRPQVMSPRKRRQPRFLI